MLATSQYQPRQPAVDRDRDQQQAKASLTSGQDYKGRLPGLASIKEKSSGGAKN